MKCDLRIVSARLNRNVAPGARRLELIAIEFRKVDERGWPLTPGEQVPGPTRPC